jgi:hypothetical protein
MVRRFFSHFFIFCDAYAYKSENPLFFQQFFYKRLPIIKLDIYKCPFFKKIMLLYFKKKTHIFIYKIYVTLMVIKEGYSNFSLFSKLCKFAKSKNFKNSKIQKFKNSKSKKYNKLIL